MALRARARFGRYYADRGIPHIVCEILLDLTVEPCFDSFQGDPRFAALLRPAGLESGA